MSAGMLLGMVPIPQRPRGQKRTEGADRGQRVRAMPSLLSGSELSNLCESLLLLSRAEVLTAAGNPTMGSK